MTLSDKLREIASGIMCEGGLNIDEEDAAKMLRQLSYQLDEAAEVLGGLSFPDADEASTKKEAEEVWLESFDLLRQVADDLGHPWRNMHKKTGHKNIYKGHVKPPSKKRLELLKQLKEEHNAK